MLYLYPSVIVKVAVNLDRKEVQPARPNRPTDGSHTDLSCWFEAPPWPDSPSSFYKSPTEPPLGNFWRHYLPCSDVRLATTRRPLLFIILNPRFYTRITLLWFFEVSGFTFCRCCCKKICRSYFETFRIWKLDFYQSFQSAN